MAEGKSSFEAKKRAERIKYNFKVEGNRIIFDNFFTTDLANKFRNQEIKIYLYLPQGTLVAPDESVERFTRNYNTNLMLFTDYQDEGNKNFAYKVTKSELKCLNCPEILREDYGNETDSLTETQVTDDSTSTTVTIDQNGVKINKGSDANENREFKGLEVNKDGIIIKTKKS